MTPAEFTERDLDRLADYLVGALDPAEAAAIARLIESDAGWATAHRALVAADSAVQADLRRYSHSRIEPMPADVAARIDDAIRASSGTRVVSLDARRRRRVPWGAVSGVAAAAVLVLCGWLAIGGGLFDMMNRSDSGGGTAAAPAERSNAGSDLDSSAGPPSVPSPWASGTPPVLVASGRNYDAVTLGAQALVMTGQPAIAGPVKSYSSGEGAVRDAAPPALSRLADPSALSACLNAIGRTHPGRASVVDYAMFEGRPALVVIVQPLVQTSPTAVVVGPACGLTGADERAQALIR